MVETLGMSYPGRKFLSSCGHVKPENKLSASKIQWWDKPTIDILIQKGRTWKEWSAHWYKARSQLSRGSSIRFEGLRIILCGWMLCSLGLSRSPTHMVSGPHLESFFLHFILCLFLSVQAVGVSVGKNKSQTCRPSAAYIQGSTPPAVLSTGYSTSSFLGWFSTGSSWIILPLFLASAESPLDPWGTHLISSPKGCSASLHQKVAQSWNSLQWMLYIFYNMNRLRIFQIKLWFLFAS